MSALWNWVRSLDEDSIAAWANKGLLRRGMKVLAETTDANWSIGADQASARIEGYTQQLGKVGFDQLRCDCPAQVTCHHLCAFLVGLRDQLPDGEPSPAAAPEPDWLLIEAGKLPAALGSASLRKALEWLANEVEAELDMQPAAVIGTLELNEAFVVRLPLVGGLDAALCSCRKPACAHRALVVLQARRDAGKPIPPLPAVVLDDVASDRLTHLRTWLESLVIQGWSGSGKAFLDQGEALAMELKQAEMPRVSSALLHLLAMLRDDAGSRSGAGGVQDALAAVWMLVRGLRATPLPLPLRELTGVHRRSYRPVSALRLHCLGVERWDTPGGHHGFSVYFWAPARMAYLVWSEVRQKDLAPDWEPDAALEHAQLGGLGLKTMLASACMLESGWVSDNGRLSGRDGTRIRKIDAGEIEGAPVIADLAPLIAKLAADLHDDPWRTALPSAHCLRVAAQTAMQGDRKSGNWSMQVSDEAGNKVRLQGGFDGMEAVVFKELNKARAAAMPMSELFGFLRVENGELLMRPISVRWASDGPWSHLSVPWLRIGDKKGDSHEPG